NPSLEARARLPCRARSRKRPPARPPTRKHSTHLIKEFDEIFLQGFNLYGVAGEVIHHSPHTVIQHSDLAAENPATETGHRGINFLRNTFKLPIHSMPMIRSGLRRLTYHHPQTIPNFSSESGCF